MPMSGDKGLLIRQYPAGVDIFKKGDEAEEAFFVKEGRIRIYKKDTNGIEKKIATIEEGGIFGEMSMIQKRNRTSYAQAIDKSTLVIIDKALLDKKIDNADPLLATLIKILIKRLYEVQK